MKVPSFNHVISKKKSLRFKVLAENIPNVDTLQHFSNKFLEVELGESETWNMNEIKWQINIENAAAKVCSNYGPEVVDSVFRRYDAHGLYDLAPCYFSEVFGDLEQIAND